MFFITAIESKIIQFRRISKPLVCNLIFGFCKFIQFSKVLPQYLSAWTTNKVKAEGVNIVTKSRVESANVDHDSGKLVLKLDTGKELKTDHAIVAVGIQPDHQFAKK